MLPLSGQVQCASDGSKGPIARLAGLEAPKFEDNEQTFPELMQRIEKTVAFVRSVKSADLIGSEVRQISTRLLGRESLNGREYLLWVALPNFYFHVATLHAILRHSGVPLGKRDYLFPASELMEAAGGP